MSDTPYPQAGAPHRGARFSACRTPYWRYRWLAATGIPLHRQPRRTPAPRGRADLMPNGPQGPVIAIRGAREHNLKNIDVTLPRNKLVVITGLSGSGKSSLAFDTIYAEGQRQTGSASCGERGCQYVCVSVVAGS